MATTRQHIYLWLPSSAEPSAQFVNFPLFLTSFFIPSSQWLSVDCFIPALSTKLAPAATGSTSDFLLLTHCKLTLQPCSALALAGMVFHPSPQLRALPCLPPVPSGRGLISHSPGFLYLRRLLSTNPSPCLQAYRLSYQPCHLGKLWATESLSLRIKSDWNIAMLICLYIIYSCFCAEQQSSWKVVTEIIWPAKPKRSTLWPFKEKIPCPSILTMFPPGHSSIHGNSVCFCGSLNLPFLGSLRWLTIY